MAEIVFFGVSNMLSDLFDCALALGHRVGRVVRNHPEAVRPRTRSAAARMAVLRPPPEDIDLADFAPRAGEIYALGTSSPARAGLVRELEARFGLAFATLVHPTAYVSPLAEIGPGCFVGAGSVIAPGVRLAAHVFVNRSVSIGHDTEVEAFARLQPGCLVAGHVRIGAGATIGLGARVIEELEIGARAIIGAGAVVLRDVAAETTVVGVPARPFARR
jgi:sugar O-acyltransferase (sialic acid O-acetyltransferase NeuD family)